MSSITWLRCLPFGEVLARVVDDMIRPDGSDHLHLRGAAHAGYPSAERFGDLHGVRTHPPRGTDYSDVLPRFDPPVVAHGLQGGRIP